MTSHGCDHTGHRGAAHEVGAARRSFLPRLTLVAIVCALGAPSPVRADDEEERKAVARAEGLVEKLGGVTVYDQKRPGKPMIVLNLFGAKVTDADVKQLVPLKHLTTLNLGGTEVTDAGVTELTAFKNLKALSLDDTEITDAGVKALVPQKNITSLSLRRTKVTDTAVKTLAELDLSKTKVTDDGVKELQKALPDCKIRR